MLKTVSRALFSLVFPLDCEWCGQMLSSREKAVVCLACERRVSLIKPPHCSGCGRTAFDEGDLCGHCFNDSLHFDRAYGCVLYESGMKKLLHGFKFGGKKFLAPFFCQIMERFAESYLSPRAWDVVIPVPMTRKKKNERGFNQAEVLSRALAKKFSKPHDTRTLYCRPSERAQARLTKSERKVNARGRFFVKNASVAAKGHILLVDDILTTGQTGSACAQALKEAGASSVTLFALARGV